MTCSPEELGLTGPVCAVLSGGNIDPLLLTHVISHGLRAAGRFLGVHITIDDRPGALVSLLEVVRANGASVVDVIHSRTGGELALDEVEVFLTVETRGPDNKRELSHRLRPRRLRSTTAELRASYSSGQPPRTVTRYSWSTSLAGTSS